MRAFYGDKYFISTSADPASDIARLLRGFLFSTCLVVVDRNITEHVDRRQLFTVPELHVSEIEFGEKHKHLHSIESFTAEHQRHLDQRSIVVAIGGGTLLDFIGLFTGVLYRGVRFISVPTTVMAMADSAYGGKTAVNLLAKNQIGMYHAPELVYVNPNFLRTLPREFMVSGWIEILKLSFFDDNIRRAVDAIDFFVDRANQDQLTTLVLLSARLKLALLARDPHEQHEASLLLYGHPFANVFETFSWEQCDEYLPHGYAVALGMLFSSWLAGKQHASFARLMESHRRCLSRVLDIEALAHRYTPKHEVLFREYLGRDKYCTGPVLRIPALLLNSGYAEAPLEKVVAAYCEWRQLLTQGRTEAAVKGAGEIQACKNASVRS